MDVYAPPGLTRARLMNFLTAELPSMLAGRVPDHYGLATAAQARLIRAALEDVHADFVRKSSGAPGEDGVTWPPLSAETLRLRGARVKGRPGVPWAGSRTTPADRRWVLQTRREIYRREYARLRGGHVPPREAARQASVIARFLTKGAFDARQKALGKGDEGRPGDVGEALILDETGRLKLSTAPGDAGRGLGAEYHPPFGDQVVHSRPGDVSAESLVPYGDYHMRPNRGRGGSHVPARPWKYEGGVPEAWVERWAEEYKEAVAELLPDVILKLR